MSSDSIVTATAIDYATRDYRGYRKLMLDLVDRSDTPWTERSAADLGVMLVELLAFQLDRLAYAGDRVAGEAFLETATLRESIRRHAALGDHMLDRGAATTGLLHFELAPGATLELPAGTLLGGELEPGQDPETRLVFETTAVARLSAARNQFRLARSVAPGTRVLRLLATDRSPVDLHACGLRPGDALLLASADGHGEDVRVAEVTRGAVALAAPLRRAHVSGSDDRRTRVYANLVPIRRGRSSGWLWIARAGLGREDLIAGRVDVGEYLRLRITRVRALLDLLADLRPQWLADASITQLRADALRRLELCVCHLRERPPTADDVRREATLQPEQRLTQSPLARREAELDAAELSLRAALDALAVTLPSALQVGRRCSAPGQRFTLPGDAPRRWDEAAHRWQETHPPWLDEPLLFGDDVRTVEVATIAAGVHETWTEVEDFLRSGPDDRHYVLELGRDGHGTLVFGDGRHGAIPPPDARILARFVCGDPRAGNVGHRTLDRLLDPVTQGRDLGHDDALLTLPNTPDADPEALTGNPMATTGARPPAVLDDVARALRLHLQRHDVPVTASDFVALVEQRPDIAEAAVLPDTHQRVVVVARVADEHDQDAALRTLAGWLATNRLAGTRVQLRPAHMVHAAIELLLDLDPAVLAEDTCRRVRDALRLPLHADGRLLGRAWTPADIYRAVERVPGVLVAELLRLDWASARGPARQEPLVPAPDAFIRCLDADDRATGTIVTHVARSFDLRAELRFTDLDDVPPDDALRQAIRAHFTGPASPLLAARERELGPADLTAILAAGPLHGAAYRLRCTALAAAGRPLATLRLRPHEVPRLRELHLLPIQTKVP